MAEGISNQSRTVEKEQGREPAVRDNRRTEGVK